MLALVFVGTSCKKDEEKTSKDYLAAHDWKLTSVKLGNDEILELCDQDNVINFHKDGEYHEDAGAQKCNPTDSQEIMGTWSISSTTTPETLTVNYTDQTVEYKYEYRLVSIDDEKAELSITIPGFGTIVSILEKK